jgi:hypothetical protein
MTHKLIINVFCNPDGKSWVGQNSHLPLADRPVPPPALELFETPEEALARAKQLQAEAGGRDVARITVHDHRKNRSR